MGFLSKLFGKKEKEVVESAPLWYPIEEDYHKTVNIVDNCRTIEDCGAASIAIDNLVGDFDVRELRDKLCDNTFDIFLQK